MALSADERVSIEEELVKTKAIASGVVETIAVVNDVMAQLRDQSYETMAEIRSAADLLILEIRSREEKLIEKVSEVLEWKETSLKQQKKTLEDFLAELQQSIDYTSDILNEPNNQDIGEWKTAISAQLKSLQNIKDEYICKPDTENGIGFVFIYNNEQLLRSVTNYGSVVDNVKRDFDRNRKDSKGVSGIPIIPVITLNGLIVDLAEEEKKKYIDSETDSSDDDSNDDSDDDDDDDDQSDDEENSSGSSDNESDDAVGKDIPSRKGRKNVHNTNDDYVNLKKKDVASDAQAINNEKSDLDKQKIGKTMVSHNTNKGGQKLSTLL